MNANAGSSAVGHDLEVRIRSFLASLNYPALQSLEIEVHQRAVIVSGRVESFHEKQLATHCCQRVAGVLQVINNIDVEAKPPRRRN